jgi:heme A synthase
MALTESQQRVHRLAWATLWMNIGVILWGAFVRATGSGAGCGEHWPECNGEVIPRSDSIETLIELTHRATSGLALLMVLALLVMTRKAWPEGSPARGGATASMILILIEAAIGAGLVIFGLTADDPRPERAWVVGAHLVNTLFLLAALCLTCWWTAGGSRLRSPDHPGLRRLLWACMAGVCVLAATGAVTALGDTLFPSESLADGIAQDRSATAHLFIKLRIWHPALAIVTGVLCMVTAGSCRTALAGRPGVEIWGFRLQGLVIAQILFGFLNLLMLAPVWAQIIHLLLADLLWISLVFLFAEVRSFETVLEG